MIELERVRAPTDEVRALVQELEDTLAAEYPPEQRHGLSLDAIFRPHIRFYVARTDGTATGCAGVALFDGFAELKRMYVRPEARGTGVAQALLARIESDVLAAGLQQLRLETGPRQHAALRAYEKAGFRPCGPFGDYATMPPDAIAASIFMERRLVLSPGD